MNKILHLHKTAFLSFSIILLGSFPFSAFALNSLPQPSGNFSISSAIDGIFGFIWPIFVGFAVAMFIWAGAMFIMAKGEPGKIASARGAVVWGAVGIGLAVLASSVPFIIKAILGQ